MDNDKIITEYRRWLERAGDDPELIPELRAMAGDDIEDAFYQDLAFGTGGLRGVIGAGTNRMNVYTVAKASQGLANYIVRRFPEGQRRVAVSYDSRIKSELFAQVAAGVFAANGLEVRIYPELMPTPCLSYAVRALGCAAGIMVTASHNPAKYNGYKVYGPDGCQITTAAAGEILSEIEKLDVFDGVRRMGLDGAVADGAASYIPESVLTAFIEEVKKQSVLFGDKADKSVSIVYSPLNGTGLVPVLRVLSEDGFTNVAVVKEQERPDGRFPTCPYPNPEIKEAMALGLEYAERLHAEVLLATDPDCDRVGTAVKDGDKYTLLSGNEMGLLLLDYICAQRINHDAMPKDPVLIKTIVTTDMAERIAADYGVRTVNVLTGFKFIGEQICRLEREGRADSYIFGFEESYGYLSGSYVRDKDAVDGALLICEMLAFYKAKGVSLMERLNALYEKYGYCLNALHSYEFDGAAGFERMREIMSGLRAGVERVGDRAVIKTLDYSAGLDGLPKSDVIKLLLEDGGSVVVRPSGTEPKLKVYLSVSASDKGAAQREETLLARAVEGLIKS